MSEIVKRNFKYLATGVKCNAQEEILKEFVQFQVYQNRWETDIDFKSLYSDVMINVNNYFTDLTK